MSQPRGRNVKVRAVAIRPVSPSDQRSKSLNYLSQSMTSECMAPMAVSEQQFMRSSGEGNVLGYGTLRRSNSGGTFVALPDEARAVAPPNTPELLNAGLGPLPSIPSSLDTIVTQVEFDEIDEVTGHNITVEVKLPKANVAELAAAAESGGLLPIELTVDDIADRGLEGVDNASLQRSFALIRGGKETEGEAPILTGLVDASTSNALPLDYDAIAKSYVEAVV